MIDDPELCGLFKAESEEHLQSLDEGLLRLEADPGDGSTLEAVFRAAHSLKGAARMLGVDGVERLAHQLEDGLGAAHRGRVVLTGEAVDRFYRALDAMRQLVQEAVTGDPAPVDLERVLAMLRGEGEGADDRPSRPAETTAVPHPAAAPPPTEPLEEPARPANEPAPPPHPAPPPVNDSGAPPEAAPPPSAPTSPERALFPDGAARVPVPASPPNDAAQPKKSHPEPRASSADFRIETIRVEPQKLDSVMTLAGELTVSATRVVRGLTEVEELGALWEEWSKDAAANRNEAARQDRFFERHQLRLERLRVLHDRLKQNTCADAARLARMADELEESVRTMRLLPLSTLFSLFPRSVRDLARSQAKEIELVIKGGETTADKRVLEELKDPLTHLLRNAVDHGIEPPEERERAGKPRRATLVLRAYQTAANVVVELADDGRGLDLDAIQRTAVTRGVCRREDLAAMTSQQIEQLIFASGFSTRSQVSDVSGRGVGLDVVRTNVARLKGTIHVESSPGRGCLFRLEMPITLATSHVLLVEVDGRPYALPVESVEGTRLLSRDAVFRIEGRETICHEGQPISVAHLADLLELPSVAAQGSEPQAVPCGGSPCVLLSVNRQRVALLADALLDEQEVILKPLGPLLRRVRNVAGATILGNGEICMVLNPDDLVKSVREPRLPAPGSRLQVGSDPFSPGAGSWEPGAAPKALLLAEDSITTRTQMRRILEGAGYEVVTAVDGADALGKLASRAFDGLISDIEMPNVDGLQLTARIREDPEHSELPIILVTSLASEEDRRRGIEVGANAYITKGTFDQNALLDALRRLV